LKAELHGHRNARFGAQSESMDEQALDLPGERPGSTKSRRPLRINTPSNRPVMKRPQMRSPRPFPRQIT